MEEYFNKLNYNLSILITKLSNNSNSLLDFVDKIFYINLEHRKDRKNQIESEIKKIDPLFQKMERFNACTYKNDKIRKNVIGAIGCSMSHLNIVKIAKERKYKRILVFEDDFMFKVNINDLNNYMENFIKNIKYFSFLLFGTNKLKSSISIKPNIYKVHFSQTTSGYIIDESIYDKYISHIENTTQKLIETQKKELYAVDMAWHKFQKETNVYTFNTNNFKVGIQRPSYSDIEIMNVNYKT
jgi:glycosyl transferase family 25